MYSLDLVNKFTVVQHGVVARFQLVRHGFSDLAIGSLVKRGYLSRLEHGVYKLAGSPETNNLRIAQSVLCCGPHAYLSHVSLLRYLDVVQDKPFRNDDKVHVLLPRPAFHSRNIVFHRSVEIPKVDCVNRIWGIPHVRVERALIDSVSLLSKSKLDYALQLAIDRNLTTPRHIYETCNRTPSGPGRSVKKFRQILEHYLTPELSHRGVESVLESRVANVLRSINSVEFVRQYTVNLRGANYRIDFCIPERKIALEVDGFAYHRSRTTFDSDRVRQNALIAAGWIIARVTATMTDEEILNAALSIL